MMDSDQYILMGDIVKSRDFESVMLRSEFQKLIQSCNRVLDERIASPYTITLGDEFQGIATSLGSLLEAIFYLEESSLELPFKLRYAGSAGRIDTPINEKIAYGMMGDGLTSTRERLSDKGRGKPRIQVDLRDSRLSQEINQLFMVYDGIVSAWNRDYASLIVALINNDNNEEVGSKFGKNRSQIWKRRKTLQIQEYNIVKALIIQKAES